MGAFKSTVLVCNLLGVRNTTDRVTAEEIRLMIQESARDGDVQEVERIFNPVSYTHLDVYKRQFKTCRISGSFNELMDLARRADQLPGRQVIRNGKLLRYSGLVAAPEI